MNTQKIIPCCREGCEGPAVLDHYINDDGVEVFQCACFCCGSETNQQLEWKVALDYWYHDKELFVIVIVGEIDA